MSVPSVPTVTTLLTVHLKPYVETVLGSLLQQSRQDFEVVVIDSGRWQGQADRTSRRMARIHGTYSRHPRITWTFTGEGPDLKASKCPVGWATNQAIRRGHVRGRYVHTAYDDDRYLPRFMEVMAGYLDEHPNAGAVWCSQQLAKLSSDGTEEVVGHRFATGSKIGPVFDCQVDGAQVMWRAELLDKIGDPWLPEDPESCWHSDGIFLDRLGSVCGAVPAVAEVLCVHRFTPLSAYTPLSSVI